MKVGESKHYSGSQPECISTQTAGENGSERGRFTDCAFLEEKGRQDGYVEAKKRKGKVIGVLSFPC